MKRLFATIIGILVLAVGGLFLGRALMGWDDGMDYPRSEIHGTTAGNKAFVAGGIGLFRVLDSCEYYDISDGELHSCPDLPRPLHHVAMASDGKTVFASGGYIALPFEQDPNGTLFALEDGSAEWEAIAKLPHPIGQHAMVYRDEKLYLVGGQRGTTDLSTLWSYDIGTGQWAEKALMPTARHSHAIAVADNILYVSGGRSKALGTEIDIIEAYDFASDQWRVLPKMKTGRGGHSSFVRNGKLHIIGGESISGNGLIASHEILDLQSQQWSSGAPLKFPRHGFAIADFGADGDVYAIGGGARAGLQTIYSVTATIQKVNGQKISD
ncbi:Kelch repeat-containing protein [Parasphingorhabdus halotolerans]|uniref:N-acetylneuraminic acid mutarotase n=1 Tax=Parasphingorhabdus halotolerans TaxID=2725558 RepID=A0A6H2DNB7_9SPHN|nr:kelch repeat-containing protein [Parasphingorhabdus halotolerans]QJB70162.1 hypothetical protein HF685_13405 [Parasphingorhabdus halotolerans]